ncbi:hypothetical protein SNEBB_005730 [Seison nebaliae]|nr:hypothetical protein SNEBB_005730 [Seison nebaliae]
MSRIKSLNRRAAAPLAGRNEGELKEIEERLNIVKKDKDILSKDLEELSSIIENLRKFYFPTPVGPLTPFKMSTQYGMSERDRRHIQAKLRKQEKRRITQSMNITSGKRRHKTFFLLTDSQYNLMYTSLIPHDYLNLRLWETTHDVDGNILDVAFLLTDKSRDMNLSVAERFPDGLITSCSYQSYVSSNELKDSAFLDQVEFQPVLPLAAVRNNAAYPWKQLILQSRDQKDLGEITADEVVTGLRGETTIITLAQGYELQSLSTNSTYFHFVFPSFTETNTFCMVAANIFSKMAPKYVEELHEKLVVIKRKEDEISLSFSEKKSLSEFNNQIVIRKLEDPSSSPLFVRRKIKGLVGPTHKVSNGYMLLCVNTRNLLLSLKCIPKMRYLQSFRMCSTTKNNNLLLLRESIFHEHFMLCVLMKNSSQIFYNNIPLWFDEDSCSLYIAFPYPEIGTLHDLIQRISYSSAEVDEGAEKRPMMDPNWIRHFLAMIACGLNELHEMSIVHGNIKEENFVVFANGCLKITNFEYAYMETDNKRKRIFTGNLPFSSPEAMYPDVFQGVGTERDYFALASIIYNMYTAFAPKPFINELIPWSQYLMILSKMEIPTFETQFSEEADILNLIARLTCFDVKRRIITYPELKFCKFMKHLNWSQYEVGKFYTEIPYNLASVIQKAIKSNVDIHKLRMYEIADNSSHCDKYRMGATAFFFKRNVIFCDNFFNGWTVADVNAEAENRLPLLSRGRQCQLLEMMTDSPPVDNLWMKEFEDKRLSKLCVKILKGLRTVKRFDEISGTYCTLDSHSAQKMIIQDCLRQKRLGSNDYD